MKITIFREVNGNDFAPISYTVDNPVNFKETTIIGGKQRSLNFTGITLKETQF